MSLVVRPIGCSCLSRFRTSCTISAAGSGRSRWSKRSAAAASASWSRTCCCSCLDRVWEHAGLAAARPLRGGRSSAAPACRWPCTAGSGGIAARTTGPAPGPQASAGRRPVAGDHRAGAQRLRAGPLARAVRGRDPRGRPGRAGAISATRCPTRGTGSGSGWRPFRSWPRSLFWRLSRRRRQRLAAVPGALETTPALHLRRARGAARSHRRRARRAVLARPCSSPSKRSRSPVEGVAQLVQRASGRRAAARRPLRVRAAAADRSPAGWTLPIGDWRQRVRIEPTLRPELTSVVAEVALPAYLGRPEPQTEGRPRRGGLAGQGQPDASSRPPPAASWPVAGRRPSSDARGAARSPARPSSRGHRQARVPLAGRLRPGRQGAVHPGDHRPRGRGAVARLRRTCRGRKSCSTRSC